MADSQAPAPPASEPQGFIARALNSLERWGNKLPDPALLFLIGLFGVWLLSWALSGVEFTEINPRTKEPVRIENLLTGESLANFFVDMVSTFTGFVPLGVVLVAMLGVGVAEHSGLINSLLKWMLGFTPKSLLTPMLIFVAVTSHLTTDAGYVLVIPLGAVIFYAAGRHPLAGIGAAFAGVSGGFGALYIPSGIDPLLQSYTQEGVAILDPTRSPVNPLCNIFFTAASSIVIVLVGWFLTDKIVEPRLASTPVDGDPDEMPKMQDIGPREKRAVVFAGITAVLGVLALAVWSWPLDSPMRNAAGELHKFDSPIIRAIVPFIFVFFLVPGVVYGYMAGTFETHRDAIKGMSNAMSTMGYYLVMAFFASLFIAAFGDSNIGALIALKGANFLQGLGMPDTVTVVGIILLVAFVNLLVGSASAKWAMLAPIFVPLLMQLGISPELTQAAYRVGDSTTNIITPLMPYFPLVVVFGQRYVKNTGIGTISSLMIPYSVTFLTVWTIFLLIYWKIGFPLGIEGGYVYPTPQ